MGKNWAICIGANQYDNLPTLKYAQRDAELMREYFLGEAGFEKVYLFTDTSPPIDDAGTPFASQPTGNRLRRFLRTRFGKPFMTAGDNFWFFFSGHGMRHADRDYLMPSDADPHPDGIEETAISFNWVTERLRRCGADNVILVYDACRDEQRSKGLGIGEEKHKGIITIAACSPAERSFEIDELGQGAFTYALLEALRIQGEGNCATVERLYQRLRHRTGEINRQFRKPRQTPYAIAEPASKYHLILLPRQATLQDIAALREDAQEAELDGNYELAEQLWTRVLAVSPADAKALKALRRIWSKSSSSESVRTPSTDSSGNRSGVSSEPESPKEPETPSVEVKLKSEKGADYTRLRDLLAAGEWRKADEETTRVMLPVARREEEYGYLTAEDIARFPCTDLRTIDRLWVHYSQGRFGFSIQKKIYQSLVGMRRYNPDRWKTWEAFGDRVGWRRDENWLLRDEIIFGSSASAGYFPLVGGIEEVEVLFSRIQTCNSPISRFFSG